MTWHLSVSAASSDYQRWYLITLYLCGTSSISTRRYRDPCSASLNEDDLHTTKLIGDKNRRVSFSQREFFSAYIQLPSSRAIQSMNIPISNQFCTAGFPLPFVLITNYKFRIVQVGMQPREARFKQTASRGSDLAHILRIEKEKSDSNKAFNINSALPC